jgi:hypothetical protein
MAGKMLVLLAAMFGTAAAGSVSLEEANFDAQV